MDGEQATRRHQRRPPLVVAVGRFGAVTTVDEQQRQRRIAPFGLSNGTAQVAEKQLDTLKHKTQLYFTGKEGEYNVTNRLDTNYSAIAVLFTALIHPVIVLPLIPPY